jgi:hypothetical protein
MIIGSIHRRLLLVLPHHRLLVVMAGRSRSFYTSETFVPMRLGRNVSIVNGRRRRLFASISSAVPDDTTATNRSPRGTTSSFSTTTNSSSNNDDKNDQQKQKSPLSSSSAAPAASVLNPLPNFDDAREAYGAKTMKELARAMLSLHVCRFPLIVTHAKTLHNFSRRFLGDWITDTALQMSLFGHFCGGTDEVRIRPKIAQLERAGIGSILDFAAEDDVESDEDNKNKNHNDTASPSNSNSSSPKSTLADRIVVDNTPNSRVYEYETEQQCDRHVETFKRCIRAVKTLEKDGFAAVKVGFLLMTLV